MLLLRDAVDITNLGYSTVRKHLKINGISYTRQPVRVIIQDEIVSKSMTYAAALYGGLVRFRAGISRAST
jgi:hypothetical protein